MWSWKHTTVSILRLMAWLWEALQILFLLMIGYLLKIPESERWHSYLPDIWMIPWEVSNVQRSKRNLQKYIATIHPKVHNRGRQWLTVITTLPRYGYLQDRYQGLLYMVQQSHRHWSGDKLPCPLTKTIQAICGCRLLTSYSLYLQYIDQLPRE